MVDFEHLSEVLVITDKKQQIQAEETRMENNSSILRKVIVTLFVVLCFILQCSVFNSLALGGIIQI